MKRDFPRVAMALVHYPILDKEKKIVATNITNFDIHDIARAARTYGIEKYYLIHPMKEQLMFVERVMDHWRTGQGAQYNPSRRRALEIVSTAESIEAALQDWNVQDPHVVATHARSVRGSIAETFQDVRRRIWQERKPTFVLFGTGYGLTEETMRGCSSVLEPIHGGAPDGFNHLSVRSAVSICLDRLMTP